MSSERRKGLRTPGRGLIRHWRDVQCGWRTRRAGGSSGLCGCGWLRPWGAIGSLQDAVARPVKDGGCTPTPPPPPRAAKGGVCGGPPQQRPSQPDSPAGTLVFPPRMSCQADIPLRCDGRAELGKCEGLDEPGPLKGDQLEKCRECSKEARGSPTWQCLPPLTI